MSDPRETLRAIRRAASRRDRTELELRRLVREARDAGETFNAIGEAMGRSHVTALKTYRAGETGSKH